MVNAPATCSGSPVATYAAISSSRDVGEVHDGRARCAVAAGRVEVSRSAVAGVQHAGATAHRPPAPDRVVGVVGLAERLAVELQHRVAAEHEGAVRGLRRRRRRTSARPGAARARPGRGDDLRLVDAGDDDATARRRRRAASRAAPVRPRPAPGGSRARVSQTTSGTPTTPDDRSPRCPARLHRPRTGARRRSCSPTTGGTSRAPICCSTVLEPYVGSPQPPARRRQRRRPERRLAERAAARCRSTSTRAGCGRRRHLRLAAGAARSPTRSFEVVSAFDVLEHCEPEAVALRELRRVLEPGGRLLLSVPAYQWAWSDHDVANGHHRRYTRAREPSRPSRPPASRCCARRTASAGSSRLFAAERPCARLRHRSSREAPTGRPTWSTYPRWARQSSGSCSACAGSTTGVLRRAGTSRSARRCSSRRSRPVTRPSVRTEARVDGRRGLDRAGRAGGAAGRRTTATSGTATPRRPTTAGGTTSATWSGTAQWATDRPARLAGRATSPPRASGGCGHR